MRRGNKSHKVPNVKLRPAPPPARVVADSSCDPSSDSEFPLNASMVDLCPRPFKGFTICATGTMDKPTLFKMAFELGAISTSDFTDRVTHLIADSHGGAKYACALERRIPIMIPEWITEAHTIWLRGDDVDVKQGIAKHRLPIFSGVVLSLSGVEDVHRRTEINRLVTEHQGVYLKNLERPVRVTHLLCSGDTETEKMKYAEKFNKRKEAHIHLVWEEWFWDSLEFGGRFDERKYQVSRPRPERKVLHDIPSLPVQDPVADSSPNSAIPIDNFSQPKRLKPAVATGSFTVISNLPIDGEEEEMAIVNKPVPAVTLQLWQSLLKPRGFELDGGKLVRSPSKSQVTRSLPSTPTRPNGVNRNGTGVKHRKEKEKGSVISSFRRANSFAPVPVKEPGIRQPFRRNTTCPSVCSSEAGGSGLHDPVQPERESAMATLFAGCTFRLLGEARCPNVRSAIENGGGVVTDDDINDPSFIVVRLISGSKLYHDEFDDYARTKYRTECWLEHSIFHERICEPDENVAFTPLRITTPVPDAEKIHLSLSGLDQSQLCWIRRLVRAVGVTLEPTFSRRSTHLLCPSGTGAKFDKALEWRIPIVTLAWLEDIARMGTISCVDEYLVGGSSVRVADEGTFVCAMDLDPVPDPWRDKGKGKTIEVDCQMMDITNDGSASQPVLVKNAHIHDPSPWDRESDVWQHRRDKTSDARHPARSDGLFGKSRFLLHDSEPPDVTKGQASRPIPPPPPTPSARFEPPRPGPTPPTHASVIPLHVTPVRQPSGSPHDADADAQTQAQVRIPSSTSPSPMRLPPSGSLQNAFIASSLADPPDTDAITKALHESLTSLLGKRPIAEEDEGGGRPSGKRIRPAGRSNLASRDASRETLTTTPTRPRHLPRPPAHRSPTRPLHHHSPTHHPHYQHTICHPPALQAPPPDLDLNMSLFDALPTSALRVTEESARVTYEDPGQAEEKRRLWRMLGGGDDGADVGENAEVGVRMGEGVGRGGGAAAASDVSRTRRSKRAKVT